MGCCSSDPNNGKEEANFSDLDQDAPSPTPDETQTASAAPQHPPSTESGKCGAGDTVEANSAETHKADEDHKQLVPTEDVGEVSTHEETEHGKNKNKRRKNLKLMPFGDFTIGDVFESVVYWLRASRKTLDALSHACAATRHHLAHSPKFVDAVFVCRRGCHIRCYTPRKQLALEHLKFDAVWHLRECIHSVQELSLSECAITGAELTALLSFCPNRLHLPDRGAVQSLHVTGLQTKSIHDHPLKNVSHCALTALDLSRCHSITDSGLKVISCCPLTSLNLSHCYITDLGLKEISQCPLITLTLVQCYKITDVGLKEVSRCPLTTLDACGCIKIDRCLKELCCCPLTTLGLCGCYLRDEDLKEISRCQLTTLDLSKNCSVTGKGLKEISRCPLTTLVLSYCNRVADDGLQEISRCPLTTFDVSACPGVSDIGLMELSRCPLTKLNIVDCSITDKGLKEFYCCLPHCYIRSR